MPTLSIEELEEIAKRNLARDDASIAKVNAAGRVTALPGVNAPGSTDQTNATNLNLAASMDRAEDTRIGAGAPVQEEPFDIERINQRRNTILRATEQGIDPDAPALFVNPKRKQELNKELGTLTNIAHDYAMENAKTMREDFLRQKHIETANDVAGYYRDVLNIKSKPGTPEHANEFYQILSNRPLAASTASVRQDATRLAKIHRESADFLNLTPPKDMEIDRITRDSSGKEHATFKPSGETEISDSVRKEYARLIGQTKDRDKNKATVAKEELRSLIDQYPGIIGKNPPPDQGQIREKEQYRTTETAEIADFNTEEEARGAGHKAGDIVYLINPKTGKRQKARLD